jgi:hypothetical protein
LAPKEKRFRKMRTKRQKHNEASAFIKPLYKKGLAVFGTSGLVLGLGITGTSPATAVNGPFACEDANTLVAAGTSDAEMSLNVTNLENMVMESGGISQICLRGDFLLNDSVEFFRDVHFYGDGNTSIQHLGGTVFESETEIYHDITLEKLTIKNSTGSSAIIGQNVEIIESTFTGNLGGAIQATETVTVTNSVFTDNLGGAIQATGNVTVTKSVVKNSAGVNGAAVQAYGSIFTPSVVTISDSTFSDNKNASVNAGDPNAFGGAIAAYGSVIISHSTFVDNTAAFGGAVYVVPEWISGDLDVTNSTFIGNTVTGEGAEGGALFASSGRVLFSTFFDNIAPEYVVDSGDEVPGNAIYKYGSELFEVGGNIFAGGSPDPQLGYGVFEVPGTPFTDLGGNLFTTAPDTENDLEPKAPSSVF